MICKHCCTVAVNSVSVSVLWCDSLTVLSASFTSSSSRLAWMWTAKDSEFCLLLQITLPHTAFYDHRQIKLLHETFTCPWSRSFLNQWMYAIDQGSSSQSCQAQNPVGFSVPPGRQLSSQRKVGSQVNPGVHLGGMGLVGLGWWQLTQEYCNNIHILQQKRMRVSLLVY